jgi:hypothetical protein
VAEQQLRELGMTMPCCQQLMVIPVQLVAAADRTDDGHPALRMRVYADPDQLEQRARAHARQHE